MGTIYFIVDMSSLSKLLRLVAGLTVDNRGGPPVIGWAPDRNRMQRRSALGRGFFEYLVSYRLTLLGWLFCVVLQALLFFRPTPSGPPYVLDWTNYFFHAAYFEAFGAFLISSPFLIFWLLRYDRSVSRKVAYRLHFLQGCFFLLHLSLNHFDHELLRFMGIHLSVSFARTYVTAATSWEVLFDALMMDRGGPGVSLLILAAVPAAYGLWARRILVTAAPGRRRRWPFAVALVAALLPVVWPLTMRLAFTGGTFRMRKVQPAIFTLAQEWRSGILDSAAPADLDALVSRYRAEWLRESADPAWCYPDPEYPFIRFPLEGPQTRTSGPEWNIIWLQLESFRPMNMGFFNSRQSPSPTPFLDRFAGDELSASWARCLSFGPRTVHGMVAGHCSILPHSRRFIPTSFPGTRILSLPEVLRRHGYAAELFTGSDPDWDSQRLLLERWYDRVWYFPEDRELDRNVFNRAKSKILELGRSGRPFLATVVSITNHYPFRSRDPLSDIAGHDTPGERILNTMKYTDDVVREFIEALHAEAWFARTLVLVSSDHGYNLGERGGAAGQINAYSETLAVPLIIHGPHPRLPKGPQPALASLLDIAPTLLDLLGLREPLPWQGHSLAAGPRPAAAVTFAWGELLYAEANGRSAMNEPETGRIMLFDLSSDPLQQRDIFAQEPEAAASLIGRAEAMRRLNDYLIQTSRIWKDNPVRR
jgi:hypothetical protein